MRCAERQRRRQKVCRRRFSASQKSGCGDPQTRAARSELAADASEADTALCVTTVMSDYTNNRQHKTPRTEGSETIKIIQIQALDPPRSCRVQPHICERLLHLDDRECPVRIPDEA